VRIEDVNADGMPDFVQYSNTASGVYLNNSEKVDLLTQITTSQGGTEHVGYQSSHLYTNGSYTQSPNLPMPVIVVASTTISDGMGNTTETDYTYKGGLYYFGSPADRQFASFSSITQTNPNTNLSTRTYYDQGTSTLAAAPGKYNDDQAKIGKPYRIEQYYTSSSTPLDMVINKWDSAALSNNREFVDLSQSVHYRYAGDGTSAHKDTADTYNYDPSTGNMIGDVFWGEVTGADDGTFTDVGADQASTTITYAASSTSSVFAGLPQRETTVDHASSTVRDTKHYYDSQPLGTVVAGNETKTETWTHDSTFASTTKIYDGTYGLVATSTDGDGNVTAYSYDTNNLYPATTTNALGQKTVRTYDYSSGQVIKTTDPNSRVYQSLYDPLDRIATSSIPDPATGSLATKTTYVYTDSSTPGSTSVHETDYLNNATSTDGYTYFDGLGRDIQERKEAEGTNTFAVKDLTYNNVGLLASESLPYFASSTSRSTATSTAALFTNHTYDAFNRLGTTTNAVGTTTNVYSAPWQLRITDPLGHKKDFDKDAYDNLSDVVEYTSTSSATTAYAWDLNKNLTKITDALGNIRNFTYDGMGRRTAAGDLHDPADTTYGTTTYAFDDAGNATTTTDAKGQTVNHTYDVLNRPLTEDYTGAAGTEITNTYDTCTDGKGRLCSWVTTTASSTVQYNPDGQVKQETRTIGSTDYTTSYVYDRQGNIASTTYPDNSIVQDIYGDAGQLEKVQRKESTDSGYTDVISDTDYSPLGQVSYRLWGNGASTTNTYDANHLYRLTHKVTSGVATSSGTTLGSFNNPTSLAVISGGSTGTTNPSKGLGKHQKPQLDTPVVSTPGDVFSASSSLPLNTSTSSALGTPLSVDILDSVAAPDIVATNAITQLIGKTRDSRKEDHGQDSTSTDENPRSSSSGDTGASTNPPLPSIANPTQDASAVLPADATQDTSTSIPPRSSRCVRRLQRPSWPVLHPIVPNYTKPTCTPSQSTISIQIPTCCRI
jgi:YD repeat-containing protein